MPYEINLDVVDADGAIRETALEAQDAIRSEGVDEGDTRLSFLKTTGMGAGALAGGASVLGVLSPVAMAKSKSRPPAKFGKGDIGILNFALTLEYLERAFYNQATANNIVTDPETRQFLQIVTADERAHVTALKAAVRKFKGKPVKEPKFDFRNTVKEQSAFQQTAFALENTGVHAYSGQALNIKSPVVVKAAVSIVTIEARHASVIGRIINGPMGITPNGAFDKPFTASQVLAAVKKTKFIVG